jgi:hypothetical protein
MGFAKKSEVEKLRAEIEKLKSVKKQSAKKTTAPRKKKK